MSPGRERAAVAAGWMLVAAVALAWTSLDRRPPEWDHANHLERMVHCARDLAVGDVRALVERSSFYPPLAPCAAALVYGLWPSDTAAGVVTMLGFLALGMASVLALGRGVGPAGAGVAGALLFGTAPFVVFSVLNFQLDLPLAAMVALTLVALRRTDRFRARGHSLLAGLVAGLGMLTKPTFALYVLPAALAAAPRERRRVVNAVLGALVASALSLPWYGPRLLGLPAQLGARSGRLAAEQGHPDPLSWAGIGFYPAWWLPMFGVAATGLLLLGLAVGVRRRQWFLLASLILPFVAIVLAQNKNLRYALPLLPAAAAAAGLGLTVLDGRARGVVAIAASAVAVLQVSAVAFGVPPPFPLPGLGVPWALAQRPMRTDWRHREILALIARDSGGRAARVSVVPNDNFFSVSNFRYYGLRDGAPLRFTRAWDEDPIGVDYMILKSGAQGPEWTTARPRRILARLAADAALAATFPVIGEYPLPDGSVASIRARRVSPVDDATLPELERQVAAAIEARLGEVAREVQRLVVRVESGEGLREGRLARVELAADGATLAEFKRPGAARLRVTDLRVVVEGLWVNPLAARAGRLEILDARRFGVERATITAADLAAFLAEVKGFRQASVRLEEGALRLAFGQWGPDVTLRARVVQTPDRPVSLAADQVRVGPIPVPDALVKWVVRNYDPMPALLARLPVRLDVARIEVGPSGIRIAGRE